MVNFGCIHGEYGLDNMFPRLPNTKREGVRYDWKIREIAKDMAPTTPRNTPKIKHRTLGRYDWKTRGMECANHNPCHTPHISTSRASLEVENFGVLKDIDVDC